MQDGKLLYEMGKLDEAEAKLKEAGRLDPRNQAVDYYLNLIREAREALKKRDNSGVIRTTNDPAYKVENHAVVSSPKGQEPTALYFRTIKVDPGALEKGVREYLGLPEGGNRTENLGTMLRQFFAECGVDISPPKSLFFNDREGTLLVYASLLDLDIIERVVQLLNPAPPQLPASEEHGSRSAGLVQDGKLLYEMGKLDEAEAKLKEARRLDPRNQAVDYYLNLIREARSKEALKKGDSGGGMRTTNDPSHKIENHADVSFPKGQEPTALYFRTIDLDPATFEKGLRKFLGLPEGGSRAESVGVMLRRFFADIGVDISPPKSLFFSRRDGTLLVYAPLADLDKIERAVQVLNTAPPQVSIQAVFIELPRAEAKGFWDKFGSTNGPAPGGSASTATLTHAQAAAQLDRWKSMGGKNILGQFQVTTLSGRQARVSLGDWETMMTNIGQGQAKPELIPGALEITPRMTGDGPGVKLDLNATLWEFLGYAASPQTVTVIGEQAMRLERELKTHQERLQNFLASNNIVLLHEQGSSAGAEAAERSKELAALRTEVKMLEVFTLELLAKTGGKSRTASDDESSFRQGITNELNSPLAGPLADLFRAAQQAELLRAKRKELLKVLQPSDPKILKLDQEIGQEIAEQERIVEGAQSRSLAQVARRREALTLQITNLEAAAGQREQKALDASRKIAEYERLKQDVKRAQDRYEMLLRVLQNPDAGNSLMLIGTNTAPSGPGLGLEWYVGNFLMTNGTDAPPDSSGLPLPHFRIRQAATSTNFDTNGVLMLAGPHFRIPQVTTSAVPVTATSSSPHFRVLRAAAAVEVQDGQTVVLGDFTANDVSKLKDQVPVLGDLPVVGRLFRNENSQTKKKDLLILVTPTIVDPAGNPIHPQNK